MTATLTGPEATQALQIYAALGARNARFDQRKVARSIITMAGRGRLTAAIRLATRIPAPGMKVWVRLRPQGRATGPHTVTRLPRRPADPSRPTWRARARVERQVTR